MWALYVELDQNEDDFEGILNLSQYIITRAFRLSSHAWRLALSPKSFLSNEAHPARHVLRNGRELGWPAGRNREESNAVALWGVPGKVRGKVTEPKGVLKRQFAKRKNVSKNPVVCSAAILFDP